MFSDNTAPSVYWESPCVHLVAPERSACHPPFGARSQASASALYLHHSYNPRLLHQPNFSCARHEEPPQHLTSLLSAIKRITKFTMSLEALPTEILQLVLEFNTPLSLKAIIRASPRCYRIFKHSKAQILPAVAHNAVPPEVLLLAVAACDASELMTNVKASSATQLKQAGYQAVEQFLVEREGQTPPYALRSCDVDFWIRLLRLIETVEFFVTRFFQDAMKKLRAEVRKRSLSCEPPSAADGVTEDPSPTERLRLQKALFRFEIFRKFTLTSARPLSSKTFDSGLAKHLLDSEDWLTHWERDELISIYGYLCNATGALLNKIDLCIADHIVSVAERPLLDITDGVKALSTSGESQGDKSLNSRLKSMEEAGLGLFKEDLVSKRHLHVEGLVAQGLPVLRSLLQRPVSSCIRLSMHFDFLFRTWHSGRSTYDLMESRTCTRRHCPCGGPMNAEEDENADGDPPNSTSEATAQRNEIDISPQVHQDRANSPSTAWKWAIEHHVTLRHLDFQHPSRVEHPGCLFWDMDRLFRFGFFGWSGRHPTLDGYKSAVGQRCRGLAVTESAFEALTATEASWQDERAMLTEFEY